MPDDCGDKRSLSIERNLKCQIQFRFVAQDAAAISGIGRAESKAAIRGNAPIVKLSSSSKKDRWTQISKPRFWPPANCGAN
jgi:hypothetical protein